MKKENYHLTILKSWCTLEEKFLLENYGIIGMTQVRIIIEDGSNFLESVLI